ncbi:type I restriction-modification system subunit M N-terminal domain-containing protein [Pseudomonas sp. C11]|uniref:type I restriction-modification system subunit M N-terminal domain-containing protein n=1 Tax=Pseudomonas sp. C11 TaxID=3075550 RepID=UPI003A52304F
MAELDYADNLWKTADKLRGNMEPSDYKHVALNLIFLKYISDVFETRLLRSNLKAVPKINI